VSGISNAPETDIPPPGITTPMTAYPAWLDMLASGYLTMSFLCAAIILVDEFRRPQKMMIMNLVWPITALYFGPFALWGYRKSGPRLTKAHQQAMMQEIHQELTQERTQFGGLHEAPPPPKNSQPSAEQVAVGVSHCGAGCTLGDISAEWWVYLMGLTFAGGAFQTRILLDFLLAWSFGIIFQYATIAPMRGLSPGKVLIEAIRVDTLSIVAFEIGLFGWMALSYYVFFPFPHLHPTDAVFWFMMQIGMVIGYFTSWPANVFLLKSGWKEKMPQYKPEMKRKMAREMARQQHAA
jgi:hypothetical protein